MIRLDMSVYGGGIWAFCTGVFNMNLPQSLGEVAIHYKSFLDVPLHTWAASSFIVDITSRDCLAVVGTLVAVGCLYLNWQSITSMIRNRRK